MTSAPATRERNGTRTPGSEAMYPHQGYKRCSRCQAILPLEAFAPNPKLAVGLDSQCRECHREATREWRARNPDAVEAYNASRRIVHPPRQCVTCGATFTPRQTRSQRCPDCAADGLSTARALERRMRGAGGEWSPTH
jgi:DNA-directed RNA polymerase subunit RPC12/RpoP